MTHHPRDSHESVDEAIYEAVAWRVRRRVQRQIIYLAHTTFWLPGIAMLEANPFSSAESVIMVWSFLWLLHTFWFIYHVWVARAIRREVEKERVYRAYLRAQQTWQPYPDATAPYDHLADRDDNPADLDELIYEDGAVRKRKRA